MSVLDPTTPWPWLLYVLAGAGVVAFALPRAMQALGQAGRDAFRAYPSIQVVAALVFWAIWPLLALLLLLEGAATAILWVSNRFGGDR